MKKTEKSTKQKDRGNVAAQYYITPVFSSDVTYGFTGEQPFNPHPLPNPGHSVQNDSANR